MGLYNGTGRVFACSYVRGRRNCARRIPRSGLRRLITMKFHYYPETDSLYIELTERSSVDSQEASAGGVLDYDSDVVLVGIDIDHASTVTEVSGLDDARSGKVAASTSGKIDVSAAAWAPHLAFRFFKFIFRRSTTR